MSPSRWSGVVWKSICPLAAAALLFALTSPSFASINLARGWNAPTVPKSCSGAFRYAARVGNVDILEVSPVQAFAKDRRVSRRSYTGRGIYDVEGSISPLQLLTAMCG